MTFAALNALFAGQHEVYRDRIVPREDPRPAVPGETLLDPGVLGERLARFARAYETPGRGPPDARAVASLWSKHHFAALIAPTLAGAIVLDRDLPVGLASVEIVGGEDGRTLAFKLGDVGPPGTGGSDGFGPLVANHLGPLVAALARASGLAPRVLWSNAGNVVEFVVRRTEALPLARTAGRDAAAHLLASRRRGGVPNPLFEPVRYVAGPGGPRRQRRVCCLRYLIPAQSLCAACPLPKMPSAGRSA